MDAQDPHPRAAFLRDPTLAVEAAIHSLEPRLPEMRRALADARGWLGYGDADRGPAYNSTAGAAAQLLLHAAALRLPAATLAVGWALLALASGAPLGADADALGPQVLKGIAISERACGLLLVAIALPRL